MKSRKDDIDRLLKARSDIDDELRRHKTQLTVLFTDIVGSTTYFNRFGDTAGLLLLHHHDNFVIGAVRAFQGTIIKTIGDSVMAEFPDPLKATRAAIEIQHRLLDHNKEVGETERLQIRTGVNTGSGFRRGNDIYGEVVNAAARITKVSGPAQILVSSAVQEAISDSDISCKVLASISLEGMAGPVDLYEVIWSPAAAPPALPSVASFPKRPGNADPVAPTLDRYQILDRVGSGGMGIVYKALDRETEEIVALKVLHAGRAADVSQLENFRNEMRQARKITHKNVCRIYDFNRADGVTFLSMELVQGESLRRVLDRFGALGTRKAIDIAMQICEGLREVHEQGLVHRDLKPENLMIDESGNLKLMDFGLAHPISSEKATRSAGTPSYMAPEQVQGAPIDQRADIYALGLVLFETFTGTAAFTRDTPVAVALKQIQETPQNPRDVEGTIPEHISAAILRCFEKDPVKRFQSVDELQAALLENPRTSPAVLLAIRRRPWSAVAVAVAGVLAAIVIAAALNWNAAAESDSQNMAPAVAEAAAFRLAQSLNTEDAWMTFLKTYGHGKLSSTAQSRIESLRAESQKVPDAPVALLASVPPPAPPSWISVLGTVAIPSGVFTMGNESGKADEKPQHQVRLRGFHMSRAEVNNRQYLMFLEDTGYSRPKDPGFAKNYLIAHPDLPVVNVSYDDVIQFCVWASARFKASVRLPTEAEWEYAARSGATDLLYPWGSSSAEGMARFKQNAPRDDVKTAAPKTFPSNRFGLYHMSGNVAEWVSDFYSRNYYVTSPVKNPTGPESGTHRAVRGGSWADDESQLGFSRRANRQPHERSDQLGFRIVVDYP